MDYVILGIIGIALGLAIAYIIKAKKSGKKCIGCPNSSSCGGACSSCSSCASHKDIQHKNSTESNK